MPSGTVALRDVDPGRAVEVLDLRLMLTCMSWALYISTYVYADEYIYALEHHVCR